MFDQMTILGPGLLGTSLALAVKERQLAHRIVAWSRRPASRVKCAAQPWCTRVADTAEEAVSEADLVVVCSPVETIRPLVTRVAGNLKPGALVTDVGSTKSLITRFCHVSMPPGRNFVGSHPMAGSEKSGMENARSDLFHGRACFVTPLVDTCEKAVETILRFWRELDMEVATVSPERHDEIVAHISHLPHILASVLCTYLSAQDSNWRNFAGSGLRDATRIAAGSPPLWKSIIEQNSDEIVRALSEYENQLQAMKAAIANKQTFEILNLLERGKAYRESLRPSDLGTP